MIDIMRASLSIIAILSLSGSALAQFVDTNPNMATSAFGCVVPGDFDNDGDPDVLVMGLGPHDIAFTTIYRNNGGVFTDSGIPLLALAPQSTSAENSAAWGDFDQDGDLDLAMIGLTTGQVPTTRVYRNDGGTFTPLSGFLGVFAGSVAWGDYDGDGDLDLLVTGVTSLSVGAPPVTRLYRNDAGTFTSVAHPFQNAYVGPIAWADYDGDGDLDALICGADSTGALTATLWRNQGGTFVDAGANLPGMDLGEAVWGDYDGDGDLDLLFGGNTSAGPITRIYRNDAGTLTDIGAGLLPLLWSSGAWGDFDNDGDLDLMLIGYDPVAQVSRSILYRNDAGHFVNSGNVLQNVFLGCVSWIDSDGDGDLDLLLSRNHLGSDILRLYRNDGLNGAPRVAEYCAAKLNSLGCAPSISAIGTSSATAPSGFIVRSINLQNNKPGLLLYGSTGRSSTPFSGGTLCVNPPLHRVPCPNSGGTPAPVNNCSGILAADVNAFRAGSLGGIPASFLFVPGTTVDSQFWGRDSGFAAPSNTQLSNALEFLIGP